MPLRQGSGQCRPRQRRRQLARIIRAILNRAWRGEDCELAKVSAIAPVLLTHDTRMDSPIVCWQLNEDLFKLIGDIPFGWRVAPLLMESRTWRTSNHRSGSLRSPSWFGTITTHPPTA